jgi:predicted metal-binding protein
MVKIGVMICDRNRKCTGNKCFRSIIERDGQFANIPKEESIEVVGWMACGGCPGERLEFAPADMKKIWRRGNLSRIMLSSRISCMPIH